MSDRFSTPRSPAFDPTLDAPSGDAAPADEAAVIAERCARVALVTGSGPHLSGETECLLRFRLRAAAVLLFGATGLFLLHDLFLQTPIKDVDPDLLSCQVVLHWFQVGLVVVLGMNSVLLCRRCRISMRGLRWSELSIFGLMAIYLVLVTNTQVIASVRRHQVVPMTAGPWLAIIFTYALFIPNTWRRAAAAIGLMAVLPLALAAYQALRYEQVAAVQNIDQVSALALMMVFAFASSVYGASMIHSLRHEAFEAKQLGQYRLRKLIGSGGMGEVYLAEHQMLKRPCAIKLIRAEQAGDPKALARFEREVQATAKLSHFNTVEIFDYGRTEDGTFYYVMEFLPGLNLAEMVERFGPLSAERAIHLLRQTAGALAEAHGVGLVHRDIKPGNIFAAKRGGMFDVAKLLDFGLAKPLFADGDAHLTQEGVITGSPIFMSPEQATGEREPDARSDIYSLGAVAYYLVTGQPPFEGNNAMKVLMAHARDPVPRPSEIRSDIPADLEEVILRCLAKRPEDRYATAEAFEQALAACGSADAWSHAQAARWWRADGRRPSEHAADVGV